MRICLLTPELPPFRYGGIGHYVESLAAGLGKRGHDVLVAGHQLHHKKVVHHEWGRSISASWNGRFIWRFEVGALIIAAVAIRRMFKEIRPEFDIVETPNWGGHSFLLPRLSCPLIVRVSTPHKETLTRNPSSADHVIHAAERHLCRRAAAVIAHSQAIATKAAQLYGVGHKTTVIPLGIVTGEHPSFVPNKTVDVLFVGRAEHRKGVDILLLALNELLENEPQLNVTLVGTKLDAFVRDKPHLSTILTRLKTKCPARFRELGFTDEAEKKRLFQQADWVVIPSRFESFGIVAIEAMREGTPVIGSRGSGIEEIVALTPTSLLIETEDHESLVEALKQALARGPGYKITVMDSIRKTFLSQFSVDAMVEATEKIYANELGKIDELCQEPSVSV